eukprot:scaffold149_cov315-Pinguiococcus_pyrenoidosus.AAC.129
MHVPRRVVAHPAHRVHIEEDCRAVDEFALQGDVSLKYALPWDSSHDAEIFIASNAASRCSAPASVLSDAGRPASAAVWELGIELVAPVLVVLP